MSGKQLWNVYVIVREIAVKAPRIILTAAHRTVSRILSQDQRLCLRSATSTTLQKIATMET